MADNLQATPRNELLGLLSDAMYGGINYMKDPRRSQQMQGLAGLLESTGIPQTTQRMAYGEPLTNIGRANVPLLKPETADAMMNVAPFAPAVGRLASRAVRATEGLPVGMGIKDVGKTGLPSPQSLTMPSVPTVDQMKQYGRTEVVPLSKAVSFQSARNWEKFNAGKGPGDLVAGYGDKPLALRLETGEYVIYDGNHRTDLALQKGQTELPMNVIDVKSYDPAHAGRKPVPPSMSDDDLLNSLLGEQVVPPQTSGLLDQPDLSYRSTHTAPGPDYGAPLHDLTGGGQMYPDDVYSEKAVQYYGSGNRKADMDAFNLAKRVRGNPDAEVTMYRAVPKNADISAINAGDWVTLTKDYAKNHGESVLRGDYKILSQKVKAKDLWTNADSIQEFGYQPQSFKAPQQAALDLAQQRAALPVEQGGLGLLAENTPEMRAQAMGFDINTTRFHGSDQDIYAFDPAKFGKNDQGWYGRGVTTDTDPEVASSYAQNYVGDGQVVYPLVSKGKYLEWPEGQQPFSTARDAIQGTKDIQNLGYQGTQVTNDRDLYGSMPQFGTEQVTFDPANIRSRFAAFDPFRKDVATATAMGVALPDLLAAEPTPEELQRRQSASLLFP